jgi:hypothetical protein
VAPDRRFGLPHPLDVDPSEDSSSRRKAGLWQSLKRALGTSAAEPRPGGDHPELPLPAATPRPASIPQPFEPGPTAEPAVKHSLSAATSPIAEDVPFLAESTPREVRPDPPAPIAHEEQEVVPEVTVTPDSPGLPPTRLARGLASFSRENAQREKKFAHLLRDPRPAAKKPPSGSGNPG